jgi:elongation of very long chain fatty acids protein 6
VPRGEKMCSNKSCGKKSFTHKHNKSHIYLAEGVVNMNVLQELWDSYSLMLIPYAKLMVEFSENHLNELPLVSCVLYLAMVSALPKMLCSKDGKAIWKGGERLRKVMIVWNLFLSILSLFMVLGSFVPFLVMTYRRGFFNVLNDPDALIFQYNKQNASYLFWGQVFVYSKYFELFDTLFVILKNPARPVQFLQWYHHTTVLLFSWYASVSRYSAGYYFMGINALVHTFMYWYYFRMECGYRPWWSMPLTMLQISQMITGIVLNGIWFYRWYHGVPTECKWPSLIVLACVVMYGSYLYLFVAFFVRKYLGSRKPREVNNSAPAAAATTTVPANKPVDHKKSKRE